ncbi:MAG: hypothetical protein P4L65_01435 [Legionella sp.]|nr:hypothetical protein [Legionella sp.]
MLKEFKAIVAVFIWLFISSAYAGTPLWTFTPDPTYSPKISITAAGSATIKYKITNQSHKTHTLVMKPIKGITQITSGGNCPAVFKLAYQQSCTLNLLVNGNQLAANVHGGPVVCQQGSALECYQPALINVLNITLIPIARYLITPTAEAHGTITPRTPQTVLAGSSVTFTATPAAGYQVDRWLVDDGLVQKGGSTFTLSHVDANHAVEVSFTRRGTLYAGAANGSVYFSMDNGLTWNTTTSPSAGFGVNSIFATSSTLYAGSADGKVYYSTNNGTLWNATAAVPGGTAVTSAFVATVNNVLTIYTGTQDGKVYYSTDGTTWTATTNPGSGAVNSLFITSANVLYVGSSDGTIYYSLNNGSSWNSITGPEASNSVPVHNLFVANNQLYANIRRTSANSTLPPGTVDFEYTYTSNSLTNANPVWTLLSQITYTLFVNSDASVIYAGTQDGYVFSLTTGDELGFITYSPITSLFFLS